MRVQPSPARKAPLVSVLSHVVRDQAQTVSCSFFWTLISTACSTLASRWGVFYTFNCVCVFTWHHLTATPACVSVRAALSQSRRTLGCIFQMCHVPLCSTQEGGGASAPMSATKFILSHQGGVAVFSILFGNADLLTAHFWVKEVIAELLSLGKIILTCFTFLHKCFIPALKYV